jgi:hypothetical protein
MAAEARQGVKWESSYRQLLVLKPWQRLGRHRHLRVRARIGKARDRFVREWTQHGIVAL